MRQAVFEALDEDAIRDVIGGMVEKAKKGDVGAARLLLNYAVGNPTVQVKNAVIMQGDPSRPLPAAPTHELPGTSAKLRILHERAQSGRELYDGRDAERELD